MSSSVMLLMLHTFFSIWSNILSYLVTAQVAIRVNNTFKMSAFITSEMTFHIFVIMQPLKMISFSVCNVFIHKACYHSFIMNQIFCLKVGERPHKRFLRYFMLTLLNSFMTGGPYHTETSPLICTANQWTGFYMIRTSIMKELLLSSRQPNPTFTSKILKNRSYLASTYIFREQSQNSKIRINTQDGGLFFDMVLCIITKIF